MSRSRTPAAGGPTPLAVESRQFLRFDPRMEDRSMAVYARFPVVLKAS
jgi:hypothetical protein